MLGAPDIPARTKELFIFSKRRAVAVETFDYKPLLKKMHGQNLPDSVERGNGLRYECTTIHIAVSRLFLQI